MRTENDSSTIHSRLTNLYHLQHRLSTIGIARIYTGKKIWAWRQAQGRQKRTRGFAAVLLLQPLTREASGEENITAYGGITKSIWQGVGSSEPMIINDRGWQGNC